MGDNLNNMREELSKGQLKVVGLIFLMSIILIFQVYFQIKKIAEYTKKRNEAENAGLKAAYDREVKHRKINLILLIVIPIIIGIVFRLN